MSGVRVLVGTRKGAFILTATATRLIRSLTINAPPRNREEEARKAHERAAKRFG
ncbi:MAG TPA: hypothetical protein VGQ06_01250 [Gemmatimonadales bacterium]|jgi:hypothetical protein|nr:hypothetical protein [Gemmatimonadales bacterium]